MRLRLGERTLTQYHDGKSGYLSQSLLPLYFGRGDVGAVDGVEVVWPSGRKQTVPGPIEAADSVGSTSLQRLRWGDLPQVTPELASFVLYRFEVNIRASAVMGLVGAGGIGADLAQALRFKEYGTAGLGLIIVVVGTIAVDFVSGSVRRRIVAGRRRRYSDTGCKIQTEKNLQSVYPSRRHLHSSRKTFLLRSEKSRRGD